MNSRLTCLLNMWSNLQGRHLREGRGGNCPPPLRFRQKNNMQCKTPHTRRHIPARRLPYHCDVQTVCLHKYVTAQPPSSPNLMFHFLKSSWRSLLPEARFFSLKFTKYRLAAGLRPDPLKRSPDPLPAIRGLLLKGGKGRRAEEPLPHPCKTSSLPLWCPDSLFAQKYVTTRSPSTPVWCFIYWKASEDRG